MPFVKNDPKINRSGRKKGAKGKRNVPKSAEICNEIQRYGLVALKTLIGQMEDNKEKPAIRQKNAMWLAEMYFTIEDMKAAAKEPKPVKDSGSKTEEEPLQVPKAAVVSLTAVN